MKPIKLTDAELDAVFSAARPLDPDLRDPFLQAVAHALQQDCSSEIGSGTWHPSAARCSGSSSIRRTSTAVPGWARKGGGIRAAAET